MRTDLLASIDIGTNTFRLLVGVVYQKDKHYMIEEVHSERVITRLGSGIPEGNILRVQDIETGIRTLKGFSRLISRYNVSGLSAIGTSALREARNKDVFIKRAREEAGINVRIVSEEEEARLTATGMTMDIPVEGSLLLVDIGGGSTELIFMDNGSISNLKGLRLGAVYLTEQYMRNDPPSKEELRAMERHIIGEVNNQGMGLPEGTTLIGTAGTITTLSAMLQGLDRYDHSRIHKSRLTLDSINRIYEEITRISMKQRAEVYPVLLDRRADIIVAGTLILRLIMRAFGFEEMTVSDHGLREGIIIDLFKRIRGWS